MFKLFQPNKIFQITSKAPKYILLLFVIVLSIGLMEALILSPEDYKQSDAVRIMYVHVPAAWISLGIFSSITVLSISGFIFKNKNLFLIAKSLAPSGFVFNIIALVTGSIWGKPTWGTWWAWDARIISTLILFIMYLGLISLHDSFTDNEKADKFLAILVIVGSVNIPIIKMSVEWWSTLHQTASITVTEKPAIDPSMLYPLFGSIIGFTGIVFCLVILSSKLQILKREKNKSWVKDYV